MITVNSWDELLELGKRSILDHMEIADIYFPNELVITVKVSGSSWNEYIDYRGAKYLLELQDSVNRLYKEMVNADSPLPNLNERLTVKVRVIEGSSIFEVNFGEAFKEMIQRISGTQVTLIATLTILTAGGYFTVGKVLDYKKEITLSAQQDQSQLEMVRQITPALDKALDIIQKADIEKPSRILINKMGPEDMITFHDGDEISTSEAKKLYPKKPRLRNESGYFEDDYRIHSIEFDKTPPVIRLYKSGFNIKATAQLAGDDIERLATGLENALESGQDFNIYLKLFVIYNKRGIITSSITSIGNPIENADKFEDLIKKFDSDL